VGKPVKGGPGRDVNTSLAPHVARRSGGAMNAGMVVVHA
jgi:hypothetical protein